MRFIADSSFHIGAHHLRSGTPCQDYASAGTVDSRAYAIVSDGCSSAGRTDIGSRILVLHTERNIIDRVETHSIARIRGILGLDQRDTLATLVRLVATKDRFSFGIKGDGVIAIKSREHLTLTKFEWAGNAPLYPAYEDDNFYGFISMHGGLSAPAFHSETWIKDDSGYKIICEETSTVEQAIKEKATFTFGYSPQDSFLLAIFSDGVLQVDGVPWQDVVISLMDIKSPEGSFVKRRLNRFIADAKANGRGPIDDIAMAAIAIVE